jgi:hypothetical protein
MGGLGVDGAARKEVEAFDPVQRTWEPLPDMVRETGFLAAVPVAGGLVVAGTGLVELFDEESGRWLALPHPMAESRSWTRLVSVPASALMASAGAAVGR